MTRAPAVRRTCLTAMMLLVRPLSQSELLGCLKGLASIMLPASPKRSFSPFQQLDTQLLQAYLVR